MTTTRDEIWLAEIWTNDEEWVAVGGCFYDDIDDAKRAILEEMEMEVEAGWVPQGGWMHDPETSGEWIEFTHEEGTLEIPCRVRALSASC